ncbi:MULTISPECIES: ABC transporter permease [Kitasatospora]|uniref:ABC-2 family transporter protein n=1 Tax=Kitasatospora cystarginea TaxID=58350 RepID=A0ABN3DDL3_9ACTN
MNRARLLTVHLRAALKAELQYRGNFAAQALDAVIGLGVALGAIEVLFSRVDSLAGWTAPQLVLLTGIYLIVGGIVNLVVHPSLSRFVREVLNGTFDFVLLKPIDAQLLVGLREVQVWKAVDISLGCAVVGVALGIQGLPGPAPVAGALLLVGVGACLMCAVWFIAATSVFWLIRIDNILAILQSCFQSAKWPAGVYPRWLRTFLTVVLPMTVSTAVPAEFATGRGSLLRGTFAVLACGALCVLSRWLWKRGLRRYASASS